MAARSAAGPSRLVKEEHRVQLNLCAAIALEFFAVRMVCYIYLFFSFYSSCAHFSSVARFILVINGRHSLVNLSFHILFFSVQVQAYFRQKQCRSASGSGKEPAIWKHKACSIQKQSGSSIFFSLNFNELFICLSTSLSLFGLSVLLSFCFSV